MLLSPLMRKSSGNQLNDLLMGLLLKNCGAPRSGLTSLATVCAAECTLAGNRRYQWVPELQSWKLHLGKSQVALSTQGLKSTV